MFLCLRPLRGGSAPALQTPRAGGKQRSEREWRGGACAPGGAAWGGGGEGCGQPTLAPKHGNLAALYAREPQRDGGGERGGGELMLAPKQNILTPLPAREL